MTIATLLISLIREYNTLKRIDLIINYIDKRYKDIRTTYFEHNIIKKELIEYNKEISFDQQDYANPIVLSFLENKKSISSEIVSYADNSSFKQYFQTWGSDGYCLLVPSKNIGIWVFYSKNRLLLKNDNWLDNIMLIINGFIEVELIYKKNERLEKQNIYLSQELNKGALSNYGKIQQAYVEQNWIDETVQGRRLKRYLPSLSQNNKTLMIVGKSGYGKTHLTNIIHQLRNNNLAPLREIDLLGVNNLVELERLIKNLSNTKDIYIRETILIKNIEYLTDYLIETLIKLLAARYTQDNTFKIITNISDKFFIEKGNILRFFSDEKILLSDRLITLSNRKLFLEDFINYYTKCNPDFANLLSKNIKNHIINKKDITKIKQLKHLLKLIYEQHCLFNPITKESIDNILSHSDWYQPNSLNWKIEEYEKALVLQSLLTYGWSQKEVAKNLMIPRRTLNYKCQKYGLYRNEK